MNHHSSQFLKAVEVFSHQEDIRLQRHIFLFVVVHKIDDEEEDQRRDKMVVGKAVRFFSTVHGTSVAMRVAATGGQKNGLEDLARKTFFSPEHFPKFLACSMTLSGVAGYQYMNHIKRQQYRRSLQQQ